MVFETIVRVPSTARACFGREGALESNEKLLELEGVDLALTLEAPIDGIGDLSPEEFAQALTGTEWKSSYRDEAWREAIKRTIAQQMANVTVPDSAEVIAAVLSVRFDASTCLEVLSVSPELDAAKQACLAKAAERIVHEYALPSYYTFDCRHLYYLLDKAGAIQDESQSLESIMDGLNRYFSEKKPEQL